MNLLVGSGGSRALCCWRLIKFRADKNGEKVWIRFLLSTLIIQPMYLVTLIKLHGTDDGGKILKERTKITIKIISSYVTQQWGHLGFCFSATFPVQQYAQILTAEAYTKGRGKEAKMLPWKMIAIVRRFVQVGRSGVNSWFMYDVKLNEPWKLFIFR